MPPEVLHAQYTYLMVHEAQGKLNGSQQPYEDLLYEFY